MFVPMQDILKEERFEAIREFLIYAQAELRFRPESLKKYQSSLAQLGRQLPKKRLEELDKADLLRIKARFVERELSDSWLSSTLLMLKRFLLYCRDERGLEVLDPGSITVPKRARKEVVYLTADEVDRLVGAIKLTNVDGSPHMMGLRLRAIIEMLLGSGLRISELLSIDRTDLDFKAREAKIIGKGGRERTAFFTARALEWLSRYLDARSDAHPAIFVNEPARQRLDRSDLWKYFRRAREQAGISKRVTPHILRHTAATQLLFNGCPMGHIKEILGHARLETTCRYYLGVDKRAAKAAHMRYLVYQEVVE